MTIKKLLSKINSEKEVTPKIIESFFDIEMSDNSFYNVIEFMEWSKNSEKINDFDKIKSAMIRIFSPYILEKFKDKIDNTYEKIDKVLSEHNASKSLSDESYTDLVYHIIGLGENMVKMVLKYPLTAKKIIDRNEVKESFELCIPEKEDYQNISEFYYHEWAEGLLNEIKINEKNIARSDLMKLRRVTRVLNLISSDNKIELKVTLNLKFEEIDKFIIEVIESSIPLDYSFQNLIIDYYGFMVPFIEE
jgi:hypothetical protein